MTTQLKTYAKSNSLTFQDWANHGHWSNWQRFPERSEFLLRLVTDHLDRQEPDYVIGTTSLCDAILPVLDDIARDYFSGGLTYLRKHGKLDGYFHRSEKQNGRTFGHKTLLWKNPIGALK